MNNTSYSVRLKEYKESAALQQLLQAADEAASNFLDHFIEDADYFDEFTITINGVTTAFVLGGPQYDALLAFVCHIADENGYSVDCAKSIVEE